MTVNPIRFDLIASIVETLTHSIKSGEWGEYLPAERQLSRELQVGRSSLRKAMLVLEKKKLIRVAHGKRTRIVKPQRGASVRQSRVVAAFIKGSPENMDSLTSWRLNNLQHDLQAAGLTLEIFCEGNEIGGMTAMHIEKLLATHKAACWVLFAGNQHIQELFFKSQAPCFLVGTPHPGIPLPHIDIDFKAVCRHAAGQLLRLGHRNIALITRDVKFPGAMSSIEGFLEVSGLSRDSQVSAQVIRFDADARDIAPFLQKVLASPSRPTGVITISAELALMCLTTLLSMGLRVPKDISLISRDYRNFLRYTHPAIASYDINHNLFRKKLSRSIIELVDTGALGTKTMLIVPEIHGDASFGSVPM